MLLCPTCWRVNSQLTKTPNSFEFPLSVALCIANIIAIAGTASLRLETYQDPASVVFFTQALTEAVNSG
jgi:hypothetical protein